MDKVRFGRALGYGARHAAKALKDAAEAAGTADPKAFTSRPTPVNAQTVRPRASAPQSAQAKAPSRRGSAFAPLKQFSSTVSLQVMGTMFGLFAVVMFQAVLHMRAALRGDFRAPETQRVYLASIICVLFTWFAISSFVRASRKSQR